MTTLLITLLFLNAAFNLVVWPPFLRRVRNDARAFHSDGKPTRFFTVHMVLITTALVIAAASLVAGIAALVS